MTGLNSWLKGSQTTAKSFFIPQLLPKSSHRVSTTYLKDLNLLTCKISEKKSNALKSHILVITQFQRTCSQSGKWENRAWGPRRVRTKEDRGRWDWGIDPGFQSESRLSICNKSFPRPAARWKRAPPTLPITGCKNISMFWGLSVRPWVLGRVVLTFFWPESWDRVHLVKEKLFSSFFKFCRDHDIKYCSKIFLGLYIYLERNEFCTQTFLWVAVCCVARMIGQ